MGPAESLCLYGGLFLHHRDTETQRWHREVRRPNPDITGNLERPDDPFLPFLLYNGVSVVGKVLEEQIVTGKVPQFRPDTSEVVSRLRLAVIERQSLSTAGAHLVQIVRHGDQLAALAERLRDTPAGEMALYRMGRNQ